MITIFLDAITDHRHGVRRRGREQLLRRGVHGLLRREVAREHRGEDDGERGVGRRAVEESKGTRS